MTCGSSGPLEKQKTWTSPPPISVVRLATSGVETATRRGATRRGLARLGAMNRPMRNRTTSARDGTWIMGGGVGVGCRRRKPEGGHAADRPRGRPAAARQAAQRRIRRHSPTPTNPRADSAAYSSGSGTAANVYATVPLLTKPSTAWFPEASNQIV